MLEEIVRHYLVLAPRFSDSLGEFFEKVERRWREEGVELLSEDEAMELANEELYAMRWETENRVGDVGRSRLDRLAEVARDVAQRS